LVFEAIRKAKPVEKKRKRISDAIDGPGLFDSDSEDDDDDDGKTLGWKASKLAIEPKKQKPMSRQALRLQAMKFYTAPKMQKPMSKRERMKNLQVPRKRRSVKRKAKKQKSNEVEVLVTENWEQRNVKNMQVAKANGNFVELLSDDDDAQDDESSAIIANANSRSLRRPKNKASSKNLEMPSVPIAILLTKDKTSWNVFASSNEYDDIGKLVPIKTVKSLYQIWKEFINDQLKNHDKQQELLARLKKARDEQFRLHEELKDRAQHLFPRKQNSRRKKTDPPLTISHIKDRTARTKCEMVLANFHDLQHLSTFADQEKRKTYQNASTQHFMITMDCLSKTVHNNSNYIRDEPLAVVLASRGYERKSVGKMMMKIGKQLIEGSEQAVCTDNIEKYQTLIFGNQPSNQFKATVERKKRERKKLERRELERDDDESDEDMDSSSSN